MLNDTTKDDLAEDCKKSFAAVSEKFGLTFQPLWLSKLNRDELAKLADWLDDVWVEIH